MTHNYYIIKQIAEELHKRCEGLFFARAYSIHSHELRIEFGDIDRSEVLVARLAPGSPSLYLANEVHEPPKRNVASFFSRLEGQELAGVQIARYDRLIHLQLGDYTLVLRFYDRPNTLLFHAQELIDTFKKSSGAEGLIAIRDEPFDSTRSLALLSKPLRKELALRNIGVDEFEEELRASAKAYVYPAPDLLVSPIQLQSLSSQPEISDPSEAVEETIIRRHRIQALESSRSSLLTTVDTILDKTSTARNEASGALSDSSRIDRYTHIGQDILARSYELPKGTASIVVSYNGTDHTIELDPALSPYDNANRYFEKARTAKARKADVVKRIESLNQDEEKLLLFRERTVEATSLKDLDQIRKELSAGHYTLQQAADAIGTTGPRFREFEVAGGMRVLVGKNAKQNDELTLHVAQKDDLWFHARHVSGSHVVLRSGKHPNIPQRAIEQAAELAAYFSDARTQTHAPVAYTRRKYVRKPRGAAPGAVKLEREEVIIVTPQISAHPIAP